MQGDTAQMAELNIDRGPDAADKNKRIFERMRLSGPSAGRWSGTARRGAGRAG